ncbi:MAG: hypothetical protein Q9195_005959 [Heterodermia aff. obscurata]
MPLTLQPVLAPDLPAAHRLNLSTNHHTEPNKTIFPNGASDTTVQYFVDLTRKQLYDPESRVRHMQVRDTETGEMVSYAMWMFFDNHKRDKGGKDGEEKTGLDSFPADANVEAMRVMFARSTEKKDEVMKGVDAYAYLGILVTHPSHRRRGAATLLLNWGLHLADLHHLPTYLESTPAALPLYQSHGFIPITPFPIPLHPFGTPLTITHTCLIRPPPSTPPPPITISPFLTNPDLASFPLIEDAAFTDSPILRQVFPPSSSTGPDPRLGTILSTTATDPHAVYLKAFLPSSSPPTIIAFAKWLFYPSDYRPGVYKPPFPPHGNQALGHWAFEKIFEARERLMAGRAYAFCQRSINYSKAKEKGF